MKLKEFFKRTEKITTEDLIKLNENIKNHLLPLFEGLSKIETEIAMSNLKEGIEEKMRVTL